MFTSNLNAPLQGYTKDNLGQVNRPVQPIRPDTKLYEYRSSKRSGHGH
jgi:hypothetical protein